MLGRRIKLILLGFMAAAFLFRFLLRIRLSRKTAAIFRWTSRNHLRRYWRE